MGKMLLIVVDSYSKWIEAEIVTSASSALTVKKLRRLFATFGLPVTVMLDNGPAFVGEEFEIFVKRNGIRHSRTTHTILHPTDKLRAWYRCEGRIEASW